MIDESRPFQAGIIDFNPKRMNDEDASRIGIPKDLQKYLGDYRQYPCNIALHFPDGVGWFSPDQEWFFKSVMDDLQKVEKLKQSDALILSGSGLSAYRFQEKDPRISEEDKNRLATAQNVVRSLLGEGKWVLGICFGGQLAVHAVGGKIGRLPENAHGNAVTEAGWLEHQLTEAGKSDAVFGQLPETFAAPHLHNDFVEKLPSVGSVVQTSSGVITVTKAEVLAIRNGYLGQNGLQNTDCEYIHASLIEFDNGARLYQIQPHPEMASSSKKANFLVRQNAWIAEEGEMGAAYYENCLAVPDDADLRVASVITSFTENAKKHLEAQQGQRFVDSTLALNFTDYLLE